MLLSNFKMSCFVNIKTYVIAISLLYHPFFQNIYFVDCRVTGKIDSMHMPILMIILIENFICIFLGNKFRDRGVGGGVKI